MSLFSPELLGKISLQLWRLLGSGKPVGGAQAGGNGKAVGGVAPWTWLYGVALWRGSVDVCMFSFSHCRSLLCALLAATIVSAPGGMSKAPAFHSASQPVRTHRIVCVSMCICVCSHMLACVHMFRRMCVCMWLCVHVCVQMCVLMCVYVCTCVCAHVCECVFLICAHVHVCVYTNGGEDKLYPKGHSVPLPGRLLLLKKSKIILC